MFEKLRNIFRKDDVIKTPDDLQKVFADAGMPDIKIFAIPKDESLRVYDPEEKLKIQLDARKGMK